MKLKLMICFILIILLSNVSSVNLNEIMPHSNNSFGNEWVELYNNGEIYLENWIIGDLQSNDTFNLTFSGFGMIVDNSMDCSLFTNCFNLSTIGSGLNDDSETIYLYDNESNLIDSFSWTSNLKTKGESFSFNRTSLYWNETQETPNQENTFLQVPNEENNTQEEDNPEIEIEIECDDEIRLGNELDVRITASNMKDSNYDLKLYIQLKNETLISEIYDSEGKDWGSGRYYLDEVINGPGNKTKTFTIRIMDEFLHMEGEANIITKIRESNSSSYKQTGKEILLLKIIANKYPSNETQDIQEDNVEVNENIINLNPQENTENIVYESKNEKMRKYSIYAFAIFLVFILMVLIWKIK